MQGRNVVLALAAVGLAWALWTLGPADDAASSPWGRGGKMEHCALAIGVIGGSILSLFANPLAGPVAVGAMSLGLIWMVATCD